jgi:hypothetical protein
VELRDGRIVADSGSQVASPQAPSLQAAPNTQNANFKGAFNV